MGERHKTHAIPALLDAKADALCRADRDYQIAAAHLYSESYEDAQTEFERIASDKQSPWRDIAPYLAARALTRAALHTDLADSKESLQKAQLYIDGLMQTNASPKYRADLLDLRAAVAYRLNPQAQLRELARAIVRPHDPRFTGDLDDLTLLLDGYCLTTNADSQDGESPKQVAIDFSKNDITDWLDTYSRTTDTQGLNIEKGRKNSTQLTATRERDRAVAQNALDTVVACGAVVGGFAF